MLDELKASVCRANLALARSGLIILTFGNVSGLDRGTGVMAIKPSGVPYDGMKPEDMVLVDLDGKTVEGSLRPSSDTPTHLELYRAFPSIGGIVHAHSRWATMFAQAGRDIPCFGTTHADFCAGPVPVTRVLSEKEVREAYEANTGKVIVERFAGAGLDPAAFPAVLVRGHGPFAWAADAEKAVGTALELELVAETAFGTLVLEPGKAPLESYIIRKHYERKHGPKAYYGQTKEKKA